MKNTQIFIKFLAFFAYHTNVYLEKYQKSETTSELFPYFDSIEEAYKKFNQHTDATKNKENGYPSKRKRTDSKPSLPKPQPINKILLNSQPIRLNINVLKSVENGPKIVIPAWYLESCEKYEYVFNFEIFSSPNQHSAQKPEGKILEKCFQARHAYQENLFEGDVSLYVHSLVRNEKNEKNATDRVNLKSRNSEILSETSLNKILSTNTQNKLYFEEINKTMPILSIFVERNEFELPVPNFPDEGTGSEIETSPSQPKKIICTKKASDTLNLQVKYQVLFDIPNTHQFQSAKQAEQSRQRHPSANTSNIINRQKCKFISVNFSNYECLYCKKPYDNMQLLLLHLRVFTQFSLWPFLDLFCFFLGLCLGSIYAIF